MSYDNNRLYSEIVNGVKKGIEVTEMYRFFGIGASATNGWFDEVGGIAYLCNNNRINMWARNKPEAIGDMHDIEDADRKANNFGLRPPKTYSTVATYVSDVNNGNLSGWTYDYPKIANNNWFRITDLDNYRKDSVCPFPSFAGGDCLIYTNSNGLNEIKIRLAQGHQEGNVNGTDYIRISDLNMSGADYSQWYPGLFFKQGNNKYWLVTTNGTSDSNLDLTLNSSELTMPTAGTYQCLVFMANKQLKVYNGQPIVNSLKIVPITTKTVEIKIITSSGALVVTAVYQSRRCVVTVTNMNASQVVITPVQIDYSTGNNGEGSVTTVKTFTTADNFTVPAGSVSNPAIVTQTYVINPYLSGAIRLVYKQKIGNGSTSANQTTSWMTIVSENIYGTVS